MKLLHNKWEYTSGKTYDPATFKNPTKGNVIKHRRERDKAPDMLYLTLEIEENGYAIIDRKHLEAVSSRCRREGVKWSLCSIKGTDKIRITNR